MRITLAELIEMAGGDLSFEVGVWSNDEGGYLEVTSAGGADGIVSLAIGSMGASEGIED